jgi:hypothetical protein
MGAWQKYGKAISAVILAGITALQAALPDQHVNNTEAMQVIIAFATAISVWIVPVIPQWRWAKTAIGLVLTGLNVILTFVVDGWQTTDLVPCILAVVTALAVTFTPAVSDTRPPTPAQP